MNKGPALFSDIGKKAKDLLTKDYSYDQKFSVSSYSNLGVGLTSTAVKKGGFSTGDISANFRHKNAVVDVKVDTESNVSAIMALSEVLPGTKCVTTLKFPDYNHGKVELQYFHEHTTFTTSVSSCQSPAADLSCTIGTQAVAIGAETGFDSASGSFTKYNFGISVANPNSSSSILLTEKGDMFKTSYLHHFASGSAVAEIARRFSTNENTFTVGSSYAIDPLTTVKGRLNNHGKLGALLQHELKPSSVLTISGEFDTKQMNKNPRFGLSLVLKP